jgi:tetratricopeptide (TPR) repeat protein
VPSKSIESREAWLTTSTKLLAFPEALKDADAAIKLDPSFVKAYIRKALVQQGMKDNTAALETLQKGTEADVEKQASWFKVVGYQ